MPIWQPTVSETGRPSSFPPGEDGQVIYIDLSFPSNAQLNCIGMEADKLYSFGFRNDEADPMQGGFAVNLRGGVTFANDTCYISGFYLNESAPGVHQGWFETFYGHIPKKDLALTTRYCLGEKRDETVPTLEPVDVR